jgi:ornithine cyclodeaminase/alanine dehydrogenase-like protein (mu-crystallin family)
MSSSLGIPVKALTSCEELVKNNDVIICIAATMDPVIQGAWIQKGTTVVAAGPTTWRAKEVDEETLRLADKIIVDSIEQAPLESGDLANAADQGIIQWSQLHELRYIVSGKYPGRDNNDQIIYTKLMGTGVADVAAAKLAYDEAKTLGLGIEMEW